MNLRTMAFAAVALTAFGTGAVSFAQTAPGPQGTPPPPPVPGPTSSTLMSTSPEPTALPSTTPTPEPFTSPTPAGGAPTATPAPRGRHRSADPSPGPSPTDTPEPPQFSTLDGVWEIQLQPLTGARTVYSHLYVTQNGNTLTGTWRKNSKTALPFTGTFDGRLFKISVTDGSSSEQLSGYEENYSDMVGLYTVADSKAPGTPFTGAHRKRESGKTIIR